VATSAPGVNRAVLTAPGMLGRPRAASIHIPGRVPGQMVGQIPGQNAGQIPARIPGKIPGQIAGQVPRAIPGQIPGKSLWQKQPPRPASAPRAIIAQPNTAPLYTRAAIAMPARQGAHVPLAYAKPNDDRALQRAAMGAGAPRAASIHIPGRASAQMPGRMLGQIPPNKMPGRAFGQVAPRQIAGQLSGQFRGQIPGQIKQAPRPAPAPRAIMAQPNTRPMPVRQVAPPPAQFVPKIPGARIETRLTVR
jgi:hypothetical protein